MTIDELLDVLRAECPLVEWSQVSTEHGPGIGAQITVNGQSLSVSMVPPLGVDWAKVEHMEITPAKTMQAMAANALSRGIVAWRAA